MKKYILLSLILIAFLAWLTFRNSNMGEIVEDKNSKEGYQLAQLHCKSCHQFPEPALLNKSTWVNYVLPKMGELVGYRSLGFNHYVANGNPSLITLDQWNKIAYYYTSHSPSEPLKRDGKVVPIQMGLKIFNPIISSFVVRKPVTTMVKIDSLNQRLFFGDGLSQKLFSISNKHTAIDSFSVGTGISNLKVINQDLLVLTMGVLYPSDIMNGQLTRIDSHTKKAITLLDSLQRPVNVNYADLNSDGLEDIIVCEFGNNTGQLSWFEQKSGNKYTKHILRPLPGAIKTDVYDFNKDGKHDIIALMAQGDEGIFIYFNQGGGTFKEERIIQLPPSYGSNYFELADINNDGHPDIIATNGDNGDYPPILKAYHGVRIYLNDKNNKFKEEIFLPMHGVGKAIAKDFDGDGDLDIASISFFPDYTKTPEEGFIYWENNGRLQFNPFTFKEVTAGSWISMDAGDLDGDGDLDIVLGNAHFRMGENPMDLKKEKDTISPAIIILKNTIQ
jgi:hypothetical protein